MTGLVLVIGATAGVVWAFGLWALITSVQHMAYADPRGRYRPVRRVWAGLGAFCACSLVAAALGHLADLLATGRL